MNICLQHYCQMCKRLHPEPERPTIHSTSSIVEGAIYDSLFFTSKGMSWQAPNHWTLENFIDMSVPESSLEIFPTFWSSCVLPKPPKILGIACLSDLINVTPSVNEEMCGSLECPVISLCHKRERVNMAPGQDHKSVLLSEIQDRTVYSYHADLLQEKDHFWHHSYNWDHYLTESVVTIIKPEGPSGCCRCQTGALNVGRAAAANSASLLGPPAWEYFPRMQCWFQFNILSMIGGTVSEASTWPFSLCEFLTHRPRSQYRESVKFIIQIYSQRLEEKPLIGSIHLADHEPGTYLNTQFLNIWVVSFPQYVLPQAGECRSLQRRTRRIIMMAFAMILHCPSLMKPSLDFSQWFWG